MRILVTGGAGHVGSHLVDRLLKEKHEIVVLDNLSNGSPDNLQHHLAEKGFKLVQGTILDESLMSEAMRDCQLVYHLAAVVGVRRVVEDPRQNILVNFMGTEIVLRLAHQRGSKVILASTSEIYGKGDAVPFSEDVDRLLGPTQVARWSYSTAKALGEHLALAYAQKSLPVVILRYFNSYGPRLRGDVYGGVVARFLRQALENVPLTIHGDGSQSRCFTYIDDLVRGTILAATMPEAEGEVFNIGNDRETSILELAQTIMKITRSRSTITFVPCRDVFGDHFEDPPRRQPDVLKAKRLLGFEAMVSLEEGLKRTARWMRSRM